MSTKQPRRFTSDQKREFLRLLLNDGPKAARGYMERVSMPACFVFETAAEADAYFKAGGKGWVIILTPDDSRP